MNKLNSKKSRRDARVDHHRLSARYNRQSFKRDHASAVGELGFEAHFKRVQEHYELQALLVG